MKTIFMFIIVCALSAAVVWAGDPRQLDLGGVKLGAPGTGLKTHIENLEDGYTCRDLVGKMAKLPATIVGWRRLAGHQMTPPTN